MSGKAAAADDAKVEAAASIEVGAVESSAALEEPVMDDMMEEIISFAFSMNCAKKPVSVMLAHTFLMASRICVRAFFTTGACSRAACITSCALEATSAIAKS